MNRAIDEILDFVTSAPTLDQIIEFAYSDETVERVNYLNEHQGTGDLSREEQDELREFDRAAYVMEQLKLRARRRMGTDATPLEW